MTTPTKLSKIIQADLELWLAAEAAKEPTLKRWAMLRRILQELRRPIDENADFDPHGLIDTELIIDPNSHQWRNGIGHETLPS